MKLERIQEALTEAERFLRSARAAKKTLEQKEYNNGFYDTRLTAACMRASMDLTRALAKVRQDR